MNVNQALTLLQGVELPDEVELSCDVTINSPIGLAGEDNRVVLLELAGIDNPMLLTTGAILWVTRALQPVTQPVINRQFRIEPGRTYRVRFVRQADNIRTLVNGEEILSTRITLGLTPYLIMQAGYGADGSSFSVDNLEVRASSAALRRSDARSHLANLFDQYLLPEDVRQALDDDTSTAPEIRDLAARLLPTFPLPGADRLNEEAWKLVTNANLNDDDVAAMKAWFDAKQVWHIVTPLQGGGLFNGLDQETDLESNPSLEALREMAISSATVTVTESSPGEYIDLLQTEEHSDAIAYALAQIECDREQTVTVRFGSDDGGKVWLNGEFVHTARINRIYTERQDAFTMTLKKGINSVLVKVSQNTGEWGFGLDLVDERGVPANVKWVKTSDR